MTDYIISDEMDRGYCAVVAGVLKGELTRCKDCHWHYGTICRKNNTFPWEDDDFCSNAERKEE